MPTSKQKLLPLGARLVVRPVEQVEKSKGGIFIPDVAKNKPIEGIVVGIGDGKQDTTFQGEWPPVAKGDRILFGRYAGTEVLLEDTGEEVRILGVEEVLAIVK